MIKRTGSIFIAIIITIALLSILFSQIELNNVVEMLVRIEPVYLAAGFFFYALSTLFRALRLHILLNREIGVKDLFSIVCIHNMVLNVFPARSGELSMIYLLNKYHKRSFGEGAASLILIRILDFITISFLFFIFAFMVHDLSDKIIDATKIIGLILLFAIILMLIFIRNSDIFIDRLRIISIILNINERHFINYLFRNMDEMSESFKKLTFDRFIWSIILSIFIYAMVYSMGIIIVKAMGISIALESLLFALTFFFMTSIIPFQGIGGFGTYEGGWAISFMAVGVAKEVAISSGFLVHSIGIIYLIILFLIGLIGISKYNKTKQRYTN